MKAGELAATSIENSFFPHNLGVTLKISIKLRSIQLLYIHSNFIEYLENIITSPKYSEQLEDWLVCEFVCFNPTFFKLRVMHFFFGTIRLTCKTNKMAILPGGNINRTWSIGSHFSYGFCSLWLLVLLLLEIALSMRKRALWQNTMFHYPH